MTTVGRSSPPPDGGYGWIIVLASIIINSTIAPITQCFGIIFEQHFQNLNISGAEISFLLHFQNTIMCSLGLFTGLLFKKFSFRQVSFCGCVLVSLGITLTSIRQSYGYLIFSIGILIERVKVQGQYDKLENEYRAKLIQYADVEQLPMIQGVTLRPLSYKEAQGLTKGFGIGQGVIMPSTALATSVYFKKRLTFAMTLSVTGVGLLPIVMPHICNYFLNVYEVKGTILLFSAISFHSLIGAMLLRPLKPNVKKPKWRKTTSINSENPEKPLMVYNETTTSIKDDKAINKSSKLFTLFNLELLRERAYVIIIIGMGVSYVAELNFILMMPFVLSELAGFTRADIALALSIQAAADISGRLFVPTFMHKTGWTSKIMYCTALLGSCLGRTMLAIFCDSRSAVLFSAVIIGLSKGSKAVYQSLILPNYISLDKLPAAIGFLMVVNGILSFIVGPIIGGIHDLTNSYFYALHTATVLSLFCVGLWGIDYCLTSSKLQNVETDIDLSIIVNNK